MNVFVTNTMNVQRNGSLVATALPVQIDTISVDIILTSQGTIPIDSYEAYCQTVSFTPQRGDYLIDTTSGATYQVFGNPAIYVDHWEARVTKYLGSTP
jgi:hypothetical protein